MQRRQLLAVLAGGPAPLARYIGSSDAPNDRGGVNDRHSTNSPSGRGTTATTDDPSPDAEDPPSEDWAASATKDPTLAVRDVETYPYAIRLNELGRSPGGDVPTLPELTERRRAVVESAIDGGFLTGQVSDWLAAFLDEYRHVLVDGRYYRLSASIPTYRITADVTTEDEVEGRIAGTDQYREAVTHDGVVETGLLRIARRDGYERHHLTEGLSAFLDTFDAVRYRGDLLSVGLSVADPGTPYEVTVDAVDPESLADTHVWNAGNAVPPVADAVRAAGRASGLYPMSDPPEGLIDELLGAEYVYLDGTFYTASVENRRALPVSLGATFVDSFTDDGSDTRLRITLSNESESSTEIVSGAPWPLGVLRYRRFDGGAGYNHAEEGGLLWTDAYEASEHVHTDGHTVTGVDDIAIGESIEAGQSVDRIFELETDDIQFGRYVVEGSVGVGTGGGGTFPYRITFTAG